MLKFLQKRAYNQAAPGVQGKEQLGETLERRTTPVEVLVTGGAAGNITVTGIASGDEIQSVLYTNFTTPAQVLLTSEFTITTDNTISNTGGTATTGGKLLVRYLKLT